MPSDIWRCIWRWITLDKSKYHKNNINCMNDYETFMILFLITNTFSWCHYSVGDVSMMFKSDDIQSASIMFHLSTWVIFVRNWKFNGVHFLKIIMILKLFLSNYVLKEFEIRIKEIKNAFCWIIRSLYLQINNKDYIIIYN